MTTTADMQIVPREPASIPALRAADQGVAESLESVLSDNTHRVYGTQWRIFTGWCDEVGLTSLPAEPLTVARYLAARAGSGASIATIRLATSAISKTHEWAKLESPCRDPGVRASLKGWGRRLSKPKRQSGALTADVLAVIRLTAVQPRKRGRGIETPDQAAKRGKFDVALVAVLSDGGLRRSEASSLTWGDVQRWDDGSGRITVIRSKTDVEAQGAVVAITPAAMGALSAIRPSSADGEMKVFGLSESQIARRVKAIARAAGLADWEFFSGHSGRVGMARRMAQNGAPTTRSNVRAAGSRAAAWSDATPEEKPPDQHCGICSHSANTDPWRFVPARQRLLFSRLPLVDYQWHRDGDPSCYTKGNRRHVQQTTGVYPFLCDHRFAPPDHGSPVSASSTPFNRGGFCSSAEAASNWA